MYRQIAQPLRYGNAQMSLTEFAALLLLSGADYLTAFTADQLHALVMFFLDLHEYGVFIASIFCGLWLLPLGYLVFKSGYIPRILGVLLMIGCFGYLIPHHSRNRLVKS